MDKLVWTGQKVTISNDGATIMRLLDIVHPAAQMMVDISMSQDAEVGDGTTSVVLLSSEFLKQAKGFIEDAVHPQIVVRAYRRASRLAVERRRGAQLEAGVGAQGVLRPHGCGRHRLPRRRLRHEARRREEGARRLRDRLLHGSRRGVQEDVLLRGFRAAAQGVR